MVRITEDMVRRRAEHNEMEIYSLEELTLHQLDIEKIEFVGTYCRELKILYLQHNLIPRIENVNRLKKLEYLNMALNNVTKIENLEGCESLNKLDLTVNFVGDLLSVEKLKANYNLRELYLTGNPCAQFEGYRPFVVAVLPQLKYLDGTEITKTERILAQQELAKLRVKIAEQQEQYMKEEEQKKKEEEQEKALQGNTETENSVIDDEAERFTPEARVRAAEAARLAREKADEQAQKARNGNGPQIPKKERRLRDGDRILQMNEGKWDFTFESEGEDVVLDLAVYRYVDTSLIDINVQPTYIQVEVKGKMLQLLLPEEVSPDKSKAERSKTTGHLVITMPKVNPVVRKPTVTKPARVEEKKEAKPTLLEPTGKTPVDLHILKNPGLKPTPVTKASRKPVVEDFVDDPDVPPLM
eukprot:Colp12_sorted_trinity150504_noHs@34760